VAAAGLAVVAAGPFTNLGANQRATDGAEGKLMKLLRSLTNRVLSLVIKDVAAGACVPENGQCCSPGLYFNCYGACVNHSNHC
jgi:hypothetical protein